jgi:hypothetical protein
MSASAARKRFAPVRLTGNTFCNNRVHEFEYCYAGPYIRDCVNVTCRYFIPSGDGTTGTDWTKRADTVDGIVQHFKSNPDLMQMTQYSVTLLIPVEPGERVLEFGFHSAFELFRFWRVFRRITRRMYSFAKAKKAAKQILTSEMNMLPEIHQIVSTLLSKRR